MGHLRKSSVTGHLLKRTTDGHLAKCWRCTECGDTLEVVVSGVDAAKCACTQGVAPDLSPVNASFQCTALAIDGTHTLTRTTGCEWKLANAGTCSISEYAPSTTCSGTPSSTNYNLDITLTASGSTWTLKIESNDPTTFCSAFFGNTTNEACPDGLVISNGQPCRYIPLATAWVSSGGTATVSEE